MRHVVNLTKSLRKPRLEKQRAFNMQQFYQQNDLEITKRSRVAGIFSSIKLGKFSRGLAAKFYVENFKNLLNVKKRKPCWKFLGIRGKKLARKSQQKAHFAFNCRSDKKQKSKAFE